MNYKHVFSYKKSEAIFETYNTFLQSPMHFQLTIFFTNQIPEVFLPIEKNILIDGLNSFGYHLLPMLPESERDLVDRSVRSMISSINNCFVSNKEFFNSLFLKNIQNNDLKLLVSNLEYLKDYQKNFIVALDEEKFLKDPQCTVKVLSNSGVSWIIDREEFKNK